jgi:hypothetical protein
LHASLVEGDKEEARMIGSPCRWRFALVRRYASLVDDIQEVQYFEWVLKSFVGQFQVTGRLSDGPSQLNAGRQPENYFALLLHV